MPWGRNVNPSKFNIEKPFLFSCWMKDYRSRESLTQYSDSRIKCLEKSGVILNWFTFSKPASQLQPLVVIPRATWATADLLRGDIVAGPLAGPEPSWLVGWGRPSWQRDHSETVHQRDAVGPRLWVPYPATKYHFIGFCDICLAFNAEAHPKGQRPI